MQALFVHGMGRSPLSGWPLLRRLRRAGITTHTFAYAVTFEGFARIERRLADRIARVASRGEYVLIGHSLGGVLIRAALRKLEGRCRLPARVFLLGSPIAAVRVARMLGRNVAYRLLAGDCGQLLASEERMQAIGALSVPTTAIVGVRGWPAWRDPFGEANDGIVCVAEASADWITDQVRVPVFHTVMPGNRHVSAAILERLRRDRA
ncbi:MAG TPA: alpha/beta fold hydrolase [Usitatibacter sp.]|nr:alpha/beta fold hydrolase [Usitatibacter sp.]